MLNESIFNVYIYIVYFWKEIWHKFYAKNEEVLEWVVKIYKTWEKQTVLKMVQKFDDARNYQSNTPKFYLDCDTKNHTHSCM